MSDIVDLSSFKTIKELRAFTSRLQQLTLSLKAELEEANNKVKHLESLLKSASSPLKVINGNMPSNEELICLEQIQRLKDFSAMRPLENEEIRSLDILVKTLNGIRGAKEEPKDVIDISSIPKAKLLSIAEESDESST